MNWDRPKLRWSAWTAICSDFEICKSATNRRLWDQGAFFLLIPTQGWTVNILCRYTLSWQTCMRSVYCHILYCNKWACGRNYYINKWSEAETRQFIRVVEHVADDIRFSVSEVVITNCSPRVVVHYLNTSRLVVWISNKSYIGCIPSTTRCNCIVTP